MIMMMNEGQIETGLCQSHASYFEFKFYNSVPDLIIITFMLLWNQIILIICSHNLLSIRRDSDSHGGPIRHSGMFPILSISACKPFSPYISCASMISPQ